MKLLIDGYFSFTILEKISEWHIFFRSQPRNFPWKHLSGILAFRLSCLIRSFLLIISSGFSTHPCPSWVRMVNPRWTPKQYLMKLGLNGSITATATRWNPWWVSRLFIHFALSSMIRSTFSSSWQEEEKTWNYSAHLCHSCSAKCNHVAQLNTLRVKCVV